MDIATILIIGFALVVVILFWILKEVMRNGDEAYNRQINERNERWDKEEEDRLQKEFDGDKEAMRDYDQAIWEKEMKEKNNSKK